MIKNLLGDEDTGKKKESDEDISTFEKVKNTTPLESIGDETIEKGSSDSLQEETSSSLSQSKLDVAGHKEEDPLLNFGLTSEADTVRNTGLAFSAGIGLFGSVVFMMLLGWLVDLYFGASPWGMVGGIILGAIIGFIQFFRTTSQILNPSKSDFEKVSLFSDSDDNNIDR